MTSAKAIAANRRNARRCTGPRTAVGKRKAARNSLRHGVIASVHSDLGLTATVARIAAALAGPGASPGLLALINPIAEAEVDILRARDARAAMIDLTAATLIADRQPERNAFVEALPAIRRLDRYERRAMSRRGRAMRALRKSFTKAKE
jgi:hypothetical protein